MFPLGTYDRKSPHDAVKATLRPSDEMTMCPATGNAVGTGVGAGVGVGVGVGVAVGAAVGVATGAGVAVLTGVAVGEVALAAPQLQRMIAPPIARAVTMRSFMHWTTAHETERYGQPAQSPSAVLAMISFITSSVPAPMRIRRESRK